MDVLAASPEFARTLPLPSPEGDITQKEEPAGGRLVGVRCAARQRLGCAARPGELPKPPSACAAR